MQESRLFKIIYHLLDKGQTTAPELAEKFEVSVRTIYRDIDALSSAGIPVYNGVVRAELLHGAVSAKDFANITTMLEAFDEFHLESPDWQILGENLYRLRKRGISVPFTDAIIATIALKHDIPIWTGDKHFLLIQSVLTGLKLYQTDETN